MNRREILVAGAAGVALLAQGREAAAQAPKKADARTALLDSLLKCVATGEACLAHCATELGKGDKSMANCNRRVHEMLALVRATHSLAALDSELLGKAAAVCATACKLCADACGEHKAHFAHGMHLECKACMEACLECEKACRAVAK
jgi:Cys-rich four helix bundle protein (predicted Tat secretion target)